MYDFPFDLNRIYVLYCTVVELSLYLHISLCSPSTKIWKATKNAKIWVVWGVRVTTQGHRKHSPRKWRISTHPTCIWSRSNFAVNFGVRKLESRGYHVVLFAWSRYPLWSFVRSFVVPCGPVWSFAVFSHRPTVTRGLNSQKPQLCYAVQNQVLLLCNILVCGIMKE